MSPRNFFHFPSFLYATLCQNNITESYYTISHSGPIPISQKHTCLLVIIIPRHQENCPPRLTGSICLQLQTEERRKTKLLVFSLLSFGIGGACLLLLRGSDWGTQGGPSPSNFWIKENKCIFNKSRLNQGLP